MIVNDKILEIKIKKYSTFCNLNLKIKKIKKIIKKIKELIIKLKGRKKFTIKGIIDADIIPINDVSIKLLFSFFKILCTINFPKIV